MSYSQIPSKATLKPTPYKLHVSDEELKRYTDLIKLSPLSPKTYENLQPDPLTFGLSHEWMSNTKSHWENNYNWRSREDRINSFPHFTVPVKDDDGYEFNMHFMALFSKKQDAIPVVFLHGWPGSFLEFLGVCDVLRNKYSEDDLPYHIIVPSLPGYALSSGPPLDKDFATEDIARVIDKLVVGLGFGDGYVIQGGDIGAYTCRPLATYPGVKAVLLNFSWMDKPHSEVKDSDVTDLEKKGLDQAERFGAHQSAYALEHGTRPATVGFVLSASPIALLAWIAEKFVTWSDETPSIDDILDSISLYWFTESFPRCIYPYRQFHDSTKTAYSIHGDPKYYIKQPLGYQFFPYELAPMPVAWVATSGNLVFHRLREHGGHFAALERPQDMVADVEEFLKVAWKQ